MGGDAAVGVIVGRVEPRTRAPLARSRVNRALAASAVALARGSTRRTAAPAACEEEPLSGRGRDSLTRLRGQRRANAGPLSGRRALSKGSYLPFGNRGTTPVLFPSARPRRVGPSRRVLESRPRPAARPAGPGAEWRRTAPRGARRQRHRVVPRRHQAGTTPFTAPRGAPRSASPAGRVRRARGASRSRSPRSRHHLHESAVQPAASGTSVEFPATSPYSGSIA